MYLFYRVTEVKITEYLKLRRKINSSLNFVIHNMTQYCIWLFILT